MVTAVTLSAERQRVETLRRAELTFLDSIVTFACIFASDSTHSFSIHNIVCEHELPATLDVENLNVVRQPEIEQTESALQVSSSSMEDRFLARKRPDEDRRSSLNWTFVTRLPVSV